ncbi:hypothetical protein ACOQFV_26440 [Nocardiopsis changdeensis]|uniref:Endonuclease/exonuclease/phosphatase family protein n=1 Tax=Nocardiopsis changdeensis TaxID=2831969 RepID=A0ABX8BEE2_9ACTN|nr:MULTISPECIES: hypothetical protein [Nocardiopsis]QUX20610.1 hypothetical protein KGD84_19095 [Nocardiopsis changdeensis]QYX36541.1 hypothetical protein K1J57_28550 [Nocardiopsis sp. MT53]
MQVPFALVNLKDGLEDGHGLSRLHPVFADYAATGTRPTLMAINEARWRIPRGLPAREALDIFETMFGGIYEIEIGAIERSDNPPALVWDPQVWRLIEESTAQTDHHRWGRNTWTLTARHDPHAAVRIHIPHLDYSSGTRRLMEAESLASQINRDFPMVVAGDLNSTGSGPHLPHRDYTKVPAHKRRQKGMLLPSGEWLDDTRALDTLIGPWDEDTGTRRHSDGCGLYAVAERDWEQLGRPAALLEPTTHTPGSLLIDWILATNEIGVVPGTYRVWDGDPAHTDHKLISVTLTVEEGRHR